MNRLWLRLSISFVLVTWLVIAVLAGLMSASIETNFGSFLNTSNSLRFGPNLINEMRSFYEANNSWDGVDTLFHGQQAAGGQGNRQSGGQGAQIFVADANGMIIYATNAAWAGQNMDTIGPMRTVQVEQNGRIVGFLGEQTPGTIALNDAEQQFLSDTATGLLLTAFGGGLLAFAVGIVISRGLTRPLIHFATTVDRMSSSDLGQPIYANGTLEISQLATAFNKLSSRLAEEEQRRQRMTTDIAHELRTPLTVMRGHVEAMMDGIYALNTPNLAVAYDQILHLARLVEDMRLLTRGESGQLSLDKTRITPGEVITLAAQRFMPLADDAEVVLKTEIEANLPLIQVDVNRIQQALDNLITNALRHMEKNGHITLSAYRNQQGEVVLKVHNTGRAIPIKNLEHVFDRFWRADEARKRDVGGTGLGLAITRLLVELHDGRIAALPITDGAAFEITLPAFS